MVVVVGSDRQLSSSSAQLSDDLGCGCKAFSGSDRRMGIELGTVLGAYRA